MTDEEKNYWALILMAKYVEEATKLREKEFVNIVYKDYRFELIFGSAFLSISSINGIYEGISDLLISLGYVGTIRSLSSAEIRAIKERTQAVFEAMFQDRDSQKLRQQFCAYYGVPKK